MALLEQIVVHQWQQHSNETGFVAENWELGIVKTHC
jgi:hypothetical protein